MENIERQSLLLDWVSMFFYAMAKAILIIKNY